ncbi:GntR family transcriptional regulator [Sphingomonas soli]|uniref:GntR family transcriptional regulator n=1 Tax=Sphingomonas soli TaxID=266127 RepID=UPI00082E4327|nr:GntR family transcriptional regulator [Sphingomonas soli]
MNAAPVFERVYAGLKAMLHEGQAVPGTRLDPAPLAAQLTASITPVRDALHRLAGERLVATTSDGFHVPMLSEPDLRDLYAWNHQLLLLALRSSTRSRAGFLPPPPPEAHSADIAEALFAAIAAAANNREQLIAIERLNDRLHAVRRAELAVLVQVGQELADMFEADLRTLRGLLGRYHRRRIAAVPDIVRQVYRPQS